jgi:hypothetical protein
VILCPVGALRQAAPLVLKVSAAFCSLVRFRPVRSVMVSSEPCAYGDEPVTFEPTQDTGRHAAARSSSRSALARVAVAPRLADTTPHASAFTHHRNHFLDRITLAGDRRKHFDVKSLIQYDISILEQAGVYMKGP